MFIGMDGYVRYLQVFLRRAFSGLFPLLKAVMKTMKPEQAPSLIIRLNYLPGCFA
jgi:hypothetical protein